MPGISISVTDEDTPAAMRECCAWWISIGMEVEDEGEADAFQWTWMTSADAMAEDAIVREVLTHILQNDDDEDFGFDGEAWKAIQSAASGGCLVVGEQQVDPSLVEELSESPAGLRMARLLSRKSALLASLPTP